jgi:4-diphosphocytidyl-2C-methyl-D-erythritol kinase
VPFLVHGGSAVVEGLGERIQVRPTCTRSWCSPRPPAPRARCTGSST